MENKTNSGWSLVLASQSPRRRELLARTGATFSVIVSAAPEESNATDPKQFALEIARVKGEAVRAKHGADKQVIVACDTVVASGCTIYGKPADRTEAKRFLLELSGKTHQVHTALVLLVNGKRFEHVETTDVSFAKISPFLLERYVASGDSLDKAGAYGIQGDAQAFITGVSGDYASVVGFPLARFCAMMEFDISSELGWTQPWQNFFS